MNTSSSPREDFSISRNASSSEPQSKILFLSPGVCLLVATLISQPVFSENMDTTKHTQNLTPSSEKHISPEATLQNGVVQKKSPGETIWTEYDRIQQLRHFQSQKKTPIFSENPKGWFLEKLHSITSFLDQEKVVEKKPKIDELLLSGIGKKYLTENTKPLSEQYFGKAVLLVHYTNTTHERGDFILLPIPRTNNENKVIQVETSGIHFSLTPKPKSNGYNTAYDIIMKPRGMATQLDILYPADTPDYKKELDEKRELETQLSSIENRIHTLSQTSKISLSRKQSAHRKKGIRIKHTDHRKELAELQEQERETKKQLNQTKENLAHTSPYQYFPYVPFTEKLNTSKVQDKGYVYLSKEMGESYNFPVSGKKISEIHSTIPGLTINKAIPPHFPLLLNLVERMDYQVYYKPDGLTLKDPREINVIMKKQATQALTTIGLNDKESYQWQKSKVGAAGIGQMMPSTLALYQKHPKYSDWFKGLDFQTASQDHHASFRLQVAHFDDQICQFPKPIRDHWQELITDSHTRIYIMALWAAGYNGNMARIIKEIFGDIPIDAPLGEYKKRLTSQVIFEKMEQARKAHIKPLEEKLQKFQQMTNKHTMKKYDHLSSAEITEIKAQIGNIHSTYNESQTYVLKTIQIAGMYLK